MVPFISGNTDMQVIDSVGPCRKQGVETPGHENAGLNVYSVN